MRRSCLFALLLAGCGGALRDEAGLGPRIAAFECDVSPPIGHPLCGGGRKPVESIESPLLAKGIVVADGEARYVLCAIDWCRIQNEAYAAFREKIAAAVGTSPSRVALQCTHCHEAPLADLGAQKLLDQSPSPPVHLDLLFFAKVTDRVAESARVALSRMRPFTHVGWGKGRVERVASNSRVFMPDGKLVERPSVTNNAAIQAQPEGKIDPWIRTITLFNQETPLIRMHYYACHPENSMSNGKVLPDVFGPLRARLEKEEGIPHLYFAACGGNVGMGKYHIPSAEECRAGAIDRIAAGIHEAIRSTQKVPITEIEWKISEARLVPKPETLEREPEWRGRLADPGAPSKNRVGAAMALAWIERMRSKPAIEIPLVRLGPVSILHLPGEPFIEYQLYAQSLSTGFVAVAGYGEGGPGYVCTDEACVEGGYQPGASRVCPPSEQRLREAIAEAMQP